MRRFKATLASISVLALLLPHVALGEPYDMADVNAKVKAITDKKLHVMEASYEPERLLSSPEFQALRAKCTTDWAQIAADIDKVQGGDEARKLVIHAFGNLPPQNYMSAVESIVTKYENDGTSDPVIDTFLYPLGRMRAFMRDNHQHPRVVAVLNKIKAKTKDPVLKSTIERLLDGTAKESLEDFRDAHDGMPEGDIPKVILAP